MGTWTIKTGKNLSAATLTANATITLSDTRYTVSQARPFANYKNTVNLTEYLRFRSYSAYKLIPIEESQALVEAYLKLFFGNSIPIASKNIAAVIALYKKGVTPEEISFGDLFLINDAKYEPLRPTVNTHAQILLEKY